MEIFEDMIIWIIFQFWWLFHWSFVTISWLIASYIAISAWQIWTWQFNSLWLILTQILFTTVCPLGCVWWYFLLYSRQLPNLFLFVVFTVCLIRRMRSMMLNDRFTFHSFFFSLFLFIIFWSNFIQFVINTLSFILLIQWIDLFNMSNNRNLINMLLRWCYWWRVWVLWIL